MTEVLPRTSTGIPRLDLLLKGGLFKGGLYVIQSSPGLGKTILANQACFHQANLNNKVAYVSLLAESTGRMISYLRPFSFFKESIVGNKLQYLSGYKILKESGIKGLQDLLKNLITGEKVTFLVIDGIDNVELAAGSEKEFREFLHSLQILISLSNCTVLLLTPNTSVQTSARPEHAVSDGVLELSEQQLGPRTIREIKVIKFRGSDYLKGRHEIDITAQAGLSIHPRTEVQFQAPVDSLDQDERIRMPFGVEHLDDMLFGGILSGSMSTLFGAPGTGKTSLGLKFLADGAKKGEHGIYFGFYETPLRLIAKAKSIGNDIEPFVKNGTLELQWQQSVENIADSLTERLLERIRAKNEKRIRIFIDGMAGFRRAIAYPDRFGSFLASLTNELRNIRATTVFSEETDFFTGSELAIHNTELGSVVDNVIYLRFVEMDSYIHRLISILKVRESAFTPEVREFKITEDGINVFPSNFKFNENRKFLSKPNSKRKLKSSKKKKKGR